MSETGPPTKPVVNSATLNKVIEDIAALLIEEEAINVILNRGKHLRYNTVDHVAYFAEIQPGTEQIDSPVLDIFGQVLHKKSNFECECPKCHRTLAAARFAPHLEKCMGMGRNSSRIASRRLAASAASSCNSSSSSASTGIVGTNDISRNSTVATNVSSVVGAQITNISDIVSEDEHFEDDGDDDEDWTMEKKKKKKAVEKSAPKRLK